MKGIMKKAVFLAAAGMTALALSGCSAGSSGLGLRKIGAETVQPDNAYFPCAV